MSTNRQEEHERVGGIAGLGAGVIAGAQIGTVFIPIPVVGTFAGGLIGGVLGSEVGKTVGAAILDGVESFAESLGVGQRRAPGAGEGTEPIDPNAP
jgi:phage tail tape-measure protein